MKKCSVLILVLVIVAAVALFGCEKKKEYSPPTACCTACCDAACGACACAGTGA